MIDLSGASKTIGFKLVLAAASGVCVAWLTKTTSYDLLVLTPGGGMLFSIGVLFPYLKRDKSFWYRGVALVALASFSFYTAMEIRDLGAVGMGPGFMPASLVGASIVLVGARFAVPLNGSFQLVVTGLTAAVIGGLVFEHSGGVYLLPFVVWHCLMAIAIHISENWSLLASKSH